MADPILVIREGRVQLAQTDHGLFIEKADGSEGFIIEPDDLLWLVTTGGPAMITLLGGPLAIKGNVADETLTRLAEQDAHRG